MDLLTSLVFLARFTYKLQLSVGKSMKTEIEVKKGELPPD